MDMRLGTWNGRSLYRAGLLKIFTTELAKNKLYLMRVQEVEWDKSGNEPVDDYTFSHGNEIADHHLGTGFFVQ